jgi:hypothetical protein
VRVSPASAKPARRSSDGGAHDAAKTLARLHADARRELARLVPDVARFRADTVRQPYVAVVIYASKVFPRALELLGRPPADLELSLLGAMAAYEDRLFKGRPPNAVADIRAACREHLLSMLVAVVDRKK